MKNIKKTITIGIPAYNESKNISKLLGDIFNQNMGNLSLSKVILVSDGSTDNTSAIASLIKDKRLYIIDRKIRKGGMETQNEILKHTTSDILILLDADIRIFDKDFIKNISEPLIKDPEVGIVGADTYSLEPNNFFEKSIVVSHEYKKTIYGSLKKGNNIYMCHGRARAFSKNIYRNIVWKKDAPEDAYSYLFCIENKKKFIYSKKAKIYFRSPSNFNDHVSQSVRFLSSKSTLIPYFDPELIDVEYKIPLSNILYSTLISLLHKPVYMSFYLILTVFIKIFLNKKKIELSMWEASPSTKETM